jgi:hypothetical protein
MVLNTVKNPFWQTNNAVSLQRKLFATIRKITHTEYIQKWRWKSWNNKLFSDQQKKHATDDPIIV